MSGPKVSCVRRIGLKHWINASAEPVNFGAYDAFDPGEWVADLPEYTPEGSPNWPQPPYTHLKPIKFRTSRNPEGVHTGNLGDCCLRCYDPDGQSVYTEDSEYYEKLTTNAEGAKTGWVLRFVSIAGSPEGVVTADTDCIAWDRSARQAYTKTTDGTNTGWETVQNEDS